MEEKNPTLASFMVYTLMLCIIYFCLRLNMENEELQPPPLLPSSPNKKKKRKAIKEEGIIFE